jgi:hypothetical protein
MTALSLWERSPEKDTKPRRMGSILSLMSSGRLCGAGRDLTSEQTAAGRLPRPDTQWAGLASRVGVNSDKPGM